MPLSPYVAALRRRVGQDLLLLPGVAAVIHDGDGRVLLQQRSDDGSWSLPAGAIEPGESLGAFLTRNAANLRKQRLHGRYRIEQIAADREIPKGRRFFFSPLINVLPFSAPVFAGLTVIRHILANGPGDGFNLTFRGEDDGSELNLHIDADSALTQAEDFARYLEELPLFLDAMLREEALTLAAAEASTAFRLAV